MTTLETIFDLSYGNKFDLNKMIRSDPKDEDAINFVGRTAKNLGITAIVKPFKKQLPYEAGLITVALGGAILTSFIQPKRFYTAQNIMVLIPREPMSFQEKLYYCICIEKNKFKYYAFGREANRSLPMLEVPERKTAWNDKHEIEDVGHIADPISSRSRLLDERKWKEFRYDALFEIKKGKRVVNRFLEAGHVPCIRPIDSNNGVAHWTNLEPNFDGNLITVNYNGNGVAEAYYQTTPFFAVDDVNVLCPKFPLNPFTALFLTTLIQKEKYRFSYGRKWHLGRMESSIIRLPVDSAGNPDWKFMEAYIKGLPYSNTLSS